MLFIPVASLLTCGIPEPDLKARHALKVYTFMSQGYHQYGIEWDARAINLEPIRRETDETIAQERGKRQVLTAAASTVPDFSNRLPQISGSTQSAAELASNRIAPPVFSPATNNQPVPENRVLGFSQHDFVWFIGGAFAAILFFLLFFQGPKRPKSRK